MPATGGQNSKSDIMQSIQSNSTNGTCNGQAKGCLIGTQPKVEKCTGRNATHDFLRASFLPVTIEKNVAGDIREWEAIYLKSLRYVEKAFGMPKSEFSQGDYPINIMNSFTAIKMKIDQVSDYEKLFLVETEKTPHCLATAKFWANPIRLYYISLAQLHEITTNKKLKKESGLLLSVCSYLMQIVAIPSYTKGDAIADFYLMLRESQQEYEEEYKEESNFMKSDLRKADYWGSKYHKSLNHPYHLGQWESRLKRYIPQNSDDDDLLTMARACYKLYQDYGQRKFYDQIFTQEWNDNGADCFSADHYVSFVWSTDGTLGNETVSYINELGGNVELIDEPLAFKIFDTPQGRQANNLEFEKELFKQLDELAYLLNQYSNDKTQ